MNYNIMMLACHYGSTRILNYIYDELILTSTSPSDALNQLLSSSVETDSDIQAVHLACFLGNLEILNILHHKY